MSTRRHVQHIDGLEIAQDLEFERRSWTAQRVSWIAGVFILVAALIGLFGNGPISRTERATRDGSLRIEYQRFVRFQAPAEYRIYIAGESAAEGEISLWVSRECFEGTLLKRITPEPNQTQLTPDGTIHTFARSSEREPIEVLFRFEIETIGRLNGAIALHGDDGQPTSRIDFSQFAYP